MRGFWRAHYAIPICIIMHKISQNFPFNKTSRKTHNEKLNLQRNENRKVLSFNEKIFKFQLHMKVKLTSSINFLYCNFYSLFVVYLDFHEKVFLLLFELRGWFMLTGRVGFFCIGKAFLYILNDQLFFN